LRKANIFRGPEADRRSKKEFRLNCWNPLLSLVIPRGIEPRFPAWGSVVLYVDFYLLDFIFHRPKILWTIPVTHVYIKNFILQKDWNSRNLLKGCGSRKRENGFKCLDSRRFIHWFIHCWHVIIYAV